MTTQASRWCFTLNNYTDAEVQSFQALGAHSQVSYLVFGKEVGEQGTPHLQGYVVFSRAWRFSRLRKLAPRAHFVAAKGTSVENRTYCSKEGDVQEFGQCPMDSKGLSKNNEELWKGYIVAARAGLFDDIPPSIYIRYRSAFNAEYQQHGPKPPCRDVLDDEWWWGDTGTGKSRTAYELYPDAYRKGLNKWWDHYNGEDVVIIEEWSPKQDQFLADKLKIWSDHYPFIAEKKGTSCYIRPKKIIITSNYCMEDCFADLQELLPLRRRFKVTHYNKPYGT